MKKNSPKTYHGSALVYALVIMSVTSIILLSLVQYTVSQIKFGYSRVEKEEALQIAEAGVYYYRWYLAHETSGKTAQQIQDFWDGSPLGVDAPYEANYEDRGRYELTVTRLSASSTSVSVESTGWTNKQPNVKRTVKVRFRRPSWSEYIFLSNSFMNFGNQAEVFGKVHSNAGIRFDGIAHSAVSSHVARFDDPTYGGNRQEFGVHTTVNPADGAAPAYPWAEGTVPDRDSDIFRGGREFPVPEVSFTGVTTDLANMKTQAQGGHGTYFNGAGAGRKISLKTDGTFDACTVSSQNVNTHAMQGFSGIVTGASGTYAGTNGNTCTASSCCAFSACPYIQNSRPNRGKCVSLANYPLVDDGIIFVENNAWVEGSISNKKITVAAAKLSGGGSDADIYIGISNFDIRLDEYDCNNMLGLVAQRDVLVLNDCPSHFIVDAALLAQSGKVGIVNGMGGKYELNFNGAIASYLQPYFQSGNSGFADRTYNFNNKLLYCPPPYFPTGTEYAMDLWEEL